MRVAGTGSPGNGPDAGWPHSTGRPASAELASSLDTIRFATILFADIVGSTRLISTLDPEDARDLLDRAVQVMKDAIHECGGMVVRVQGDGVMAVFGVHPAAEDHALRAAIAARNAVDRLRNSSMGVLPAPQARIGIHAGPVLLRQQDNDFGSIIDLVGHAAHVAGQVEKLAPPGSVAISQSTLSLITEHCETRPLATQSHSGQPDPDHGIGSAILELTRVELARGDHLPVKGNSTFPFVGRDGQLDLIRRLVFHLATGRGTSLRFTGEAGIGKSRLLLEASRIAAGVGIVFLSVRGNALTRAVPFGCLAGAVRHMVQLLAQFGGSFAATGLTHDQRLFVDAFLEGQTDWLPEMSPGDRNRVASQAIIALVHAVCAKTPLLLLADDIQYMDIASLAVLSALAAEIGRPEVDPSETEAGQTVRAAIIFAGRPEASRWFGAAGASPIALEPLSGSASRQMVAAITTMDGLSPDTLDNILERSGGLPLALQEFAVSARSESARLPARLDNLLAERLALLDDNATRLCQLCSALGAAFPASHMREAARRWCNRPDEAVRTLVAQRVLETTVGGQARFTHQLVQEAAYLTMSRRRRKGTHARILEMLEDGEAVADTEPLSHAELAAHAEKAELPESALEHLWNACQQALGLAAIESVLLLYQRAREVAAALPAELAAHERARFSLLAFDALQQLSCEQDAREDMLALAEGRVNLGPVAATVARINMAVLDWINGAPQAAEQWLAMAERDLAARESLPRRTYADVVGAYIANSLARPREAVDRIERLSARLDEGLRSKTFGAVVVIPHILARAFGAWYLTDLGDCKKARAWLTEALSLSRRHAHAYSRLLASLAHGYHHYRAGRNARAVAILRRAHATCLLHRFYGFEPACAGWLALSLIEQGLLDEAAQILQESVERGHFRKIRTSATYYLHEARARLALAQGDPALALTLAHEALTHCRDCGEAMHQLHAALLMEEILAVAQPEMTRTAERTELAERIRSVGIVTLQVRLNQLGWREGPLG
ncbi:AAA family ATPase [Novosphingobium sp. SL115]|uniref:ATP-binding protein n=1 Tax=Novosphingobium sp. SL115 TaxID=2995150 RepID=UPI0022741D75|nr:adenylate/guanylate cyclase domain-containing protein [Novosphingobium sp. SL115]MCY1669965.1 AAA family ATPase [Novosphingobium sp. SL115]